jgi:hypothetical protein
MTGCTGGTDRTFWRRPAVWRVRRTCARVVLSCLLPCVLGLSSIACRRAPLDATPEGAVRLLLDEMDSTEDEPSALERVYALLGPVARANLIERARRTKELQGRQVEPFDMLAAGLFGLAFRPKSMRSTVVADRAIVDVFGEDPQNEHARVSAVHEAGGWRIEPGLPDP